jgi:hypothetical protein
MVIDVHPPLSCSQVYLRERPPIEELHRELRLFSVAVIYSNKDKIANVYFMPLQILNYLSCGVGNTSQVSLASPPIRILSESDQETLTDGPPVPQPNPEKQSTLITSRPIIEDFQKPKRRRTFPGAVSVSERLSKLSWRPRAPGTSLIRRHTTELRLSTENSGTREKMETLYNRLFRRIEDEVWKRDEDKKQPWISLTCGKELLEDEDIKAILEAKKDRPGWKNNIERLVPFVRDNAPQLFMMLVYTRYEMLLQQFCDKGFGDAMFPVEFKLAQNHASIEGNLCMKLEYCSRFGRREAKSLFDHSQWFFFAPKLRWTAFEDPPLNSSCKLPFLTFDEISCTNFSVVYRCLIHRDHVNIDSDGFVSSQVAAIAGC